MGSVPIFLGLAVLAVPLLLFLVQDRMLFFPQPLSESQRGLIAQQFPAAREIVLDAPKVHAWHVPGEPLVLYFGGNAEDVSWMLRNARPGGPGWLLVSYRGYGGSEGAPSAANIAEDALRWYDHAARELRPRAIAVFGRSLGTGPAVHVALHRPVGKVVLVTPFDSLAEVGARHYPFLPVRLLLRHRFEPVEAAPAIRAPLLCIAAERDEVIPPAHARRLFDAWGGEKRWLELRGAGHNSTDGVPAFWQSINAFLQQ